MADENLTKTCPACGGSGELATSHKFTCYECNGRGKVTEADYVKIAEKEREIQRGADARLSAWEYRKMGG